MEGGRYEMRDGKRVRVASATQDQERNAAIAKGDPRHPDTKAAAKPAAKPAPRPASPASADKE